jgi:hypothetical protein
MASLGSFILWAAYQIIVPYFGPGLRQRVEAYSSTNHTALSPLRGVLGRGASLGHGFYHPSLTLPLKGREPEG